MNLPRLDGYGILVAEARLGDRLAVVELLIGEGARVTCVQTGRQAVDRLLHHGIDEFDLVLMDCQMPSMDGYQATELLGRAAPDLPVIGLSTGEPADERRRCLEAGMVDHVATPCEGDILIAAIRRQSRQRCQPAQPSPPQVRHLTGCSVLVADDDAIIRMVITAMLIEEGASPVCVENGRQAIDQIRHHGPARFVIVLTDVRMPEMDGFETAKQLRHLAPTLPVIGLTGLSNPEDHQRCLGAGMVDVVAKPISRSLLVAAIQRHIPKPGDAPPPGPACPPTPPDARDVTLDGPTVDWTWLQARYGNRPAFIKKLITTACGAHGSTAEELRAAIRLGDLPTIGALAHTLKGMSGNLNARPLQEAAQQTERAARANAPETLDRAHRLAIQVGIFLAELRRHTEINTNSCDD